MKLLATLLRAASAMNGTIEISEADEVIYRS